MNIANYFQIILLSFFILIFYFFGKRNKHGLNSCFLEKYYTNELRGIAILLVIVHHVGLRLGDNVFTPLGGIGVALFLIISGYGLNESFKKNGNKSFWQKKL